MVTTYSSALTERAACIVQIHRGDGRTVLRIAGELHDSPLHSATLLNTQTPWTDTHPLVN